MFVYRFSSKLNITKVVQNDYIKASIWFVFLRTKRIISGDQKVKRGDL